MATQKVDKTTQIYYKKTLRYFESIRPQSPQPENLPEDVVTKNQNSIENNQGPGEENNRNRPGKLNTGKCLVDHEVQTDTKEDSTEFPQIILKYDIVQIPLRSEESPVFCCNPNSKTNENFTVQDNDNLPSSITNAVKGKEKHSHSNPEAVQDTKELAPSITSTVKNKEKLPSSKTNEVKDKEKFSPSKTTAVKDKEKLPPSKTNGVKDKEKLPSSKTTEVKHKEKLSPSKTTAVKDKEKLPPSKTNGVKDKEKLPSSKTTEVKGKEKLPPSKTTAVKYKEKLPSSKTAAVRNKEKLPPSKTKGVKDKEKLQSSETTAVKDKEKLPPSKTTAVKDKEKVHPSKTYAVKGKEKLSPSKTYAVKDKEKLSPSKTTAVRDKEKLPPSKSVTVREKEKLPSSKTNEVRDKEKPSSSKSTAVKDKEKLSLSKTTAVKDKEKLPLTKTAAVREKEKHPPSKTNAVKDKEKLSSSNTAAVKDKEKLPLSKTTTVRDKEKLPSSKTNTIKGKVKCLASKAKTNSVQDKNKRLRYKTNTVQHEEKLPPYKKENSLIKEKLKSYLKQRMKIDRESPIEHEDKKINKGNKIKTIQEKRSSTEKDLFPPGTHKDQEAEIKLKTRKNNKYRRLNKSEKVKINKKNQNSVKEKNEVSKNKTNYKRRIPWDYQFRKDFIPEKYKIVETADTEKSVDGEMDENTAEYQVKLAEGSKNLQTKQTQLEKLVTNEMLKPNIDSENDIITLWAIQIKKVDSNTDNDGILVEEITQQQDIQLNVTTSTANKPVTQPEQHGGYQLRDIKYKFPRRKKSPAEKKRKPWKVNDKFLEKDNDSTSKEDAIEGENSSNDENTGKDTANQETNKPEPCFEVPQLRKILARPPKTTEIMEQQQMITQQDQNMSNPQMAQQQMMLCPVRLVYESPILMPSGDQMQQNQTIFINPQNPPPWMRPVQNQVIYVQQLPNNIMPIQQTVDPNLYLQQNFVSYPQMMPQQILTQNPNDSIRLPLQMQNIMPGMVQNIQQNQVQQNIQQQIQAQNVQNQIQAQNIHAQNVQAQPQNAQNQNVQDNQNQNSQNVQINQSNQNTNNDTKPQMLVNYGQMQPNIATSVANMQNLQQNQYIVNNRQMVNVVQNPGQNLNQNLVQNQLVQQQISNHLIATQKAQEMQKQTVYRNLTPQMNQTQIITRPQLPQMMGQMQNLQNIQNIQQIGQTFVPSIRPNMPIQMQNIGQNVANVQQTFVNTVPNIQTMERHAIPNADNKTSGGTVSYTAVRNGQTYTYRAIQPRPPQFRHLPNLLPMGAQLQQGQVQAAQTQTIVQTRPNLPIASNQVKQQQKPTINQTSNTMTTTTQMKQEPNTNFNRKRKSESPDEVQKKIPANTTVYGNMTVTTKPTLNVPKPIMACNEIGVNTSPVHKIEDKLPVSQHVLQVKPMDVQMNNVKQSQVTQTDKKPDTPNMNINNTNNLGNNMNNMSTSTESNMARLLEKEKLIRNTVFTQARGRLLSDKNTQSTNTVEQNVNKTSSGTNTDPNNKNEVNNSMDIDNNHKNFGVPNNNVDQKSRNFAQANINNSDQSIRNALGNNPNTGQVSRNSGTTNNINEQGNKNVTSYNVNPEQQSKVFPPSNMSAEQYVKSFVFSMNAEQNLRAFAASNAINEHNVRQFVQSNNINSEPMKNNIPHNIPTESNAKVIAAPEASPKKDEGVQTKLIPLRHIKTDKQNVSLNQITEKSRPTINDVEMRPVTPLTANITPKKIDPVPKINISEIKPSQSIKTDTESPKYSIKVEFAQKAEEQKRQEAKVKAFEPNKIMNDSNKQKPIDSNKKTPKPIEKPKEVQPTPVNNDKTSLDKLSELTHRISEPEPKLPKKEHKPEHKPPKSERNVPETSRKEVKPIVREVKPDTKPAEPVQEEPTMKSTVDSVNSELALKNRREYKNVSLNDTGEIHIVDGNIMKQDKEFILTHVLDGFVIQESNVPFAIRKPLKEKTLVINAPRILDSITECKAETVREKTAKEPSATVVSKDIVAKENTAKETVTKEATVTGESSQDDTSKENKSIPEVANVTSASKESKKIPDLSNLNLNEDKQEISGSIEDKSKRKEEEEAVNDENENPFGGLEPNAVKTWTAEELATHLSKYNWSETIAILQEHEIDGESLFLASKPQLVTIGVSETHADLICDFVKS